MRVLTVHLFLLSALLLTLFLGPIALGISRPYGTFDHGPLGLAHLLEKGGSESLHKHPIGVLLVWNVPDSGVLLVVEPERGFSDRDVASLRLFLERGGTLLLWGRGPVLEDLLVRLGTPITLGADLYSPSFEKERSFPLVRPAGSSPSLGSTVESFVVRSPRVVEGGTPLLVTDLSWKDSNSNGEPDLSEEVGIFPVSSFARVGKGVLLVVGSAWPLTLDGWGVGPGEWILSSFLPEGAAVFVDESHRSPYDLFGLLPLLEGDPRGWVAVGLSLLLTIVSTLSPRLREGEVRTP